MPQYSNQGITALTNAYVYFPFGIGVIGVGIINDELAVGDNIEVSWDGVNQARSIAGAEAYNWGSSGNGDYKFGVYLKSTPAGAAYRLETTLG